MSEHLAVTFSVRYCTAVKQDKTRMFKFIKMPPLPSSCPWKARRQSKLWLSMTFVASVTCHTLCLPVYMFCEHTGSIMGIIQNLTPLEGWGTTWMNLCLRWPLWKGDWFTRTIDREQVACLHFLSLFWSALFSGWVLKRRQEILKSFSTVRSCDFSGKPWGAQREFLVAWGQNRFLEGRRV